MSKCEEIVLRGPEHNLQLFEAELLALEGFDATWLTENPSASDIDDEGLGQVDMASLVLSIPVGLITNALYELIKQTIKARVAAKQIQQDGLDDGQ